jgi:hypothetical protein
VDRQPRRLKELNSKLKALRLPAAILQPARIFEDAQAQQDVYEDVEGHKEDQEEEEGGDEGDEE